MVDNGDHEGAALDEFLGASQGSAWRRYLQWIAVCLGAIALTLLVARFVSGGQAGRYVSEPVREGEIVVGVAGAGSLRPVSTREIGTALDGTISEVLVRQGQRVKKGQVLARIDSPPFRNALAQSHDLIAARLQSLAEAERAAELARTTLVRFERVRQRSGGTVPSDREMSAARNDASRTVDMLASARVELESARAAVATGDGELAATDIVSPIDGVAVTVASAGQKTSRSGDVPTLFTIAEPFTRLVLDIVVTGNVAGQMLVGKPARLGVPGLAGQSFTATVRQAVASPSNLTGGETHSYRLLLDVPNPRLVLRPGLAVTARIDLDRKRAVLVVPDGALRFAQASNGATGKSTTRPSVLVLEKDGTSRLVPVTTEGSDGRGTVVRTEDLRPGMRVVTGLR